MKLLILRLEGLLQSWGEKGKWDERDTTYMPSKSGVIGMIAGCMGLPRGDQRIVELSNALSMSIRMDRAGRSMMDYHTVQGMPRIINAEGKPRGGGNTFITRRYYLEDASFIVVLCGDEDVLSACAVALNDPVWVPYLGRKSCVPSQPILAELTNRYCTVKQALREYPLASRAMEKPLIQYESADGPITRMDRLFDSERRIFERRRVSVPEVLEEVYGL